MATEEMPSAAEEMLSEAEEMLLEAEVRLSTAEAMVSTAEEMRSAAQEILSAAEGMLHIASDGRGDTVGSGGDAFDGGRDAVDGRGEAVGGGGDAVDCRGNAVGGKGDSVGSGGEALGGGVLHGGGGGFVIWQLKPTTYSLGWSHCVIIINIKNSKTHMNGHTLKQPFLINQHGSGRVAGSHHQRNHSIVCGIRLCCTAGTARRLLDTLILRLNLARSGLGLAERRRQLLPRDVASFSALAGAMKTIWPLLGCGAVMERRDDD